MKCRICNKETTVKYCSRSLPVYCSTECRNKRHLKNCLNCNKEFYTAKTATKTCSDICAIKYRQSLTRSEVCFTCGKKFKRATSTFASNKKRYFCSKQCNERNYGRENRFRYGKNWTYMRNVRVFIDKRRCVKCGTREQLEVHHFIPIKKFENPDDAHYLNNLITLCRTCHKIVEECDKIKYKNKPLAIKDIV